jgi:hypothetical protein
MRVPIGGYDSAIYEGPTTRYYYGTPVQAPPSTPQSVLRSPVQAPTAPQGVLRVPAKGTTSGAKRVDPSQTPPKAEADKADGPAAGEKKEEADKPPMLPLNPPTPPESSTSRKTTDRHV